MTPASFANLINRFYQLVTDVLVAHDAVIDKMIGDEVMALFIPGFCGRDYKESAMAAGEALLRAVGDGAGGRSLPVGVGVHAGMAFVGNVGSGVVSDFTALGDSVNVAARLQEQAVAGQMVVSESVYLGTSRAHLGETRRVQLPGRREPMTVRVIDVGPSPVEPSFE